MKNTRRRYTEEFKAKVAIEAMKEQQTLSEIAEKYQIHPNQVTKWKSQLIEGAAKVFSDGRGTKKEEKPNEEILYQQIGQLQVELDWLKKKSGLK